MMDAYNYASTRDVGRLGNVEDIKNLIQLQETMKDVSAELAKTAGSLAGAANSFMGK